MSLNDWIQGQAVRGKISFSVEEARGVFSCRSEESLKTELRRLTSSNRIQQVYKGFYVIVPVQYQLKAVVPPTYYINELMTYLQKPYYVGLLSAAAIHGAAHQRVMATQVVTIAPRSRVSGNPLLDWNYRQRIPSELLMTKNAEMGTIKYSNPELTAVDLVQFATNIGGYQRVATVLAELVDEVNIGKMEAVLPYTTTASLQRFGFLLEEVLLEQEKANRLYLLLRKNKPFFNDAPLSTAHSANDHPKRNRWRVDKNIDIEIDDL